MLAIIGGTGLNSIPGFEPEKHLEPNTQFGEPSSSIQVGTIAGKSVCFLARHGQPHHLPPHKINYRANIEALRQLNVKQIIAVNAVGGIHDRMGPKALSVPDQILDYTYGREHTFYDGSTPELEHVDFTEPYDEDLRKLLIDSAKSSGIKLLPYGIYAATNGPRLETAAEILRIKNDGGDMVGMTGMPEAGLAREANIPYACIALSVNWAAGLCGLEPITMAAIRTAIDDGMRDVTALIAQVAPDLT
jgi:5'-methylthioinosine phosphorylase